MPGEEDTQSEQQETKVRMYGIASSGWNVFALCSAVFSQEDDQRSCPPADACKTTGTRTCYGNLQK